MATNTKSVSDPDGDFSDWLEITNSTNQSINIQGWFLTDDRSNLKKWRIPSLIIEPHDPKLIFASGKDHTDTLNVPHTNFKLAANGEYLALVRPDGFTIAHEYSPKYKKQRPNVSYGIHQSDFSKMGYFENFTPGKENNSLFLKIVEDTQFDHDRGFYDEEFHLVISSKTPDAKIRFTTDGSNPTIEHGTLYTEPLFISETTTVRALAFKEGYESTNVDTQTYIFPDHVLNQTGASFPPQWGSVSADYEMDPNVVHDPLYSNSIRDALLSLPTISIVMDREDLFSTASGIYTNSSQSGIQWERNGSLEVISAPGLDSPGWGSGTQINCGVRMHGGAGRGSQFFKHSFRFLFKSKHGPPKFKFPIFSGGRQLKDRKATDEFDTLILRAGFNNSWTNRNTRQQDRAQYLRDQFIRECLLAMGQPQAHGIFVHVYLNGLYWGLYNLVERPSAPFCASYFGGRKEEWDTLNAGEIIDGHGHSWGQLFANVNSVINTDFLPSSLSSHLDVNNLADYMLTNFYGGNWDWDHHNWYAGRHRLHSNGYKFFSWDAERTLENTFGDDRTGVNNTNKPSQIFNNLKTIPEFRMLFADRAYKHLLSDGAISANVSTNRYRVMAEEISEAVICESARWGDSQRDIPLTRNEEWETEKERLLNSHLPARSGAVLTHLKNAGLYPEVEPPIFSHPSGNYPEGVSFTLQSTEGRAYYTLDSSDPRLPGGEISPTAHFSLEDIKTPLVDESKTLKYLIPDDDRWEQNWNQIDLDDSAWESGLNGIGFKTNGGFDEHIQTNLSDDLYRKAGSVYVRFEFEISSLETIDFLRLRMKYDDGFAAYLNGNFLTSKNAPESLRWNSLSTRQVNDVRAQRFEDFEFHSVQDLLRVGKNVLSLQGLNNSLTNNDLLLAVELIAIEVPKVGIPITETTRVKSRTLLGDVWSPLKEIVYIRFPIRITEIHYHPQASQSPSAYGEDQFEFIEIQNTGSEILNLKDIKIKGDIQFTFADHYFVPPGGVFLIVKNIDAFEERYSLIQQHIAGEFTGNLSNRGGRIFIDDAQNERIHDFTFDDNWYPDTDGKGHSLTIRDPNGAASNWSSSTAWQISSIPHGTPGEIENWGGAQIPGDANQNLIIEIGDAIKLLRILYRGDPPPCDNPSVQSGGNLALLDFDGNEEITSADAVGLLSHLFLFSPPHALRHQCRQILDCPDLCR